jgi:hypothetical protein
MATYLQGESGIYKITNIISGEVYDSLQHTSTITNVPKYELSRRILGKRKNNTNLIYL